MALGLDEEYTETPDDQTKCVYCGKELGHKFVWAMAVTRSFKVCDEECKEALTDYIAKDKKLKTPMYMLIFVACIIYMIAQLFGIGNLLIWGICQILGGVAFFFMPYPFVSFETFYRVNIKKTVKICKVLGAIFMTTGAICSIAFFV